MLLQHPSGPCQVPSAEKQAGHEAQSRDNLHADSMSSGCVARSCPDAMHLDAVINFLVRLTAHHGPFASVA